MRIKSRVILSRFAHMIKEKSVIIGCENRGTTPRHYKNQIAFTHLTTDLHGCNLFSTDHPYHALCLYSILGSELLALEWCVHCLDFPPLFHSSFEFWLVKSSETATASRLLVKRKWWKWTNEDAIEIEIFH